LHHITRRYSWETRGGLARSTCAHGDLTTFALRLIMANGGCGVVVVRSGGVRPAGDGGGGASRVRD
jgi:hypothetical protein